MDAITYAISKKYIDNSVEGLGTIKGADCRVKSIEKITNGNRITLAWIGSSGTEVTESFDVLDGYSIVNVITDEYDHLIFTMSDGSTIDAGKLPEEKVKISSDEGNIIEQRDDGIYVPSTPVNISDTDGNILESKSDGLYATIVFETEDVDFNNY